MAETDPIETRAMRQSDHDLLVSIHTKVERVITDVKELKDNFSSRVASLEKNKIEVSEFTGMHNDHETRIRMAEKGLDDVALIKKIVYGAVGLILVSVLSSLIYLVVKS